MLADMWDFLWLHVFSVLTVSVLTKVNEVFFCLQHYFPSAGKKERDRERESDTFPHEDKRKTVPVIHYRYILII